MTFLGRCTPRQYTDPPAQSRASRRNPRRKLPAYEAFRTLPGRRQTMQLASALMSTGTDGALFATSHITGREWRLRKKHVTLHKMTMVARMIMDNLPAIRMYSRSVPTTRKHF